MDRLFFKAQYNVKKFTHFSTLTFVDKPDGYFPAKDRYLYNKLKRWLKLKGNYYPYHNRKTITQIHFKCGLIDYMRMYIDRLKKVLSRNFEIKPSYLWKYERGEDTERPHFHMFHTFGQLKLKTQWELTEKLWDSGYVDIEPIKGSEKALGYLSKYVKKSYSIKSSQDYYRPDNKRRWSCSQDIKKPPSRYRWVYYDMFSDDQYNLMISLENSLFYDENSGLFEDT